MKSFKTTEQVTIDYSFSDGTEDRERCNLPEWLDPNDPDWGEIVGNAENYYEKNVASVTILWPDNTTSEWAR